MCIHIIIGTDVLILYYLGILVYGRTHKMSIKKIQLMWGGDMTALPTAYWLYCYWTWFFKFYYLVFTA